MRQPLRPETIEALAMFAEQAGRLAAAVIRQHPAEAHNLAFTLFYNVMSSYSHAVAMGATQADMSKAYSALERAWGDALNHVLVDLAPSRGPSLN